VAFADDDSWWAPGALDLAVDLLDAHPRTGLLAARIEVGADGQLDPVSADMALAPLGREGDQPGPAVLGFIACGAVVRREAFLACGGFDDVVFFGGEEERLALDLAAAGWGLAYVDDVVAHHHPSTSRDPESRRRLLARNRVLTACLRRPWPEVGRTVVSVAGGDRDSLRGLLDAVPRVPRALTHRRRLPAAVETARRSLDVAAAEVLSRA
jgi:GT2 family glycosyltransferase